MERKNPGAAPVICRNWSRTGTCSFGARCHFAHYDAQNARPGSPNSNVSFGAPSQVVPTPLQLNSTGGAPSNQSNKHICRNWATTGSCKFGDRCHFSHSQPTSSHQNFGPPSPNSASTPPPTPSSANTGPRETSPSLKFEPVLVSKQAEQLEQRLHQLEINNHPKRPQQQQPAGGNSENLNPEDYYHPEDEHYWEEGFEAEEADEEDFDEEDFEGPQPAVKDGSSCRVEECNGVLQPHFSESGALQYYLCSSCGALFTNHPGH